jgi:glycosyltransferase involved in cell wall biosynthesis
LSGDGSSGIYLFKIEYYLYTMDKSDNAIAVVSFPISLSFNVPLSNLVKILDSSYREIEVIIGSYEKIPPIKEKHINYYNVIHKKSDSTIIKIFRYVSLQIIISAILLRKSQRCKKVIFFMELGPFLPLAVAKLLKKKPVWMLPSSFDKMSDIGGSYPKMLARLHPVNYVLADKIVVYSKGIIKEWHLEKYRGKILIGGEHHIDASLFNVNRPLDQRENLIGYIGRLSEEKGIINFLESVPLALEKWPDYRFLIVGDGPDRQKVAGLIEKYGLAEKVRCTGWAKRNELPGYMNEIKFLVIPSDTEGLPNTMLEAMACGTVVVGAPVGAIAEIIIDGVTGFIMSDNSPGEIIRALDKAINAADIREVSIRSSEYIENNFSYATVVKKYSEILNQCDDMCFENI